MIQSKHRLFEYLKTKQMGDVVSQSEILSATGWKRSTLDTYRRKNYTDPFLAELPGGKYQVLQDGPSLSEGVFSKAFTQVKAGKFVPMKGMRLEGIQNTYELESHLGEGVVAHVWRAAVVGQPLKRAAKIMLPRPDLLDPSTLDNVSKRFARESRNSQKLSHRHIVPYLDYGTKDGHPFLIMGLADRSLADLLAVRPITIVESLKVAEETTRGLVYLHQERCVHRDIKPKNILDVGGSYVLGDLGIVRWSEMNPAFTSAGTITQESIRLGSWYYMAPEQRQTPHDATAASDIYGLGISWYEMLTQKTPDPAQVGAQKFPDPTSSKEINHLIRRMVAYDPSERPSAVELLKEIVYLRQSTISP